MRGWSLGIESASAARLRAAYAARAEAVRLLALAKRLKTRLAAAQRLKDADRAIFAALVAVILEGDSDAR